MLGLFGVVMRELFSELTKLFVEGSQVELLDAHLVEPAAGKPFGICWL